MKPLRVGIIGAGLISQNLHLPWVLATPGLDVHSIVDPVIERAQSLSKSYGIRPLISASIETVLDEIDAAVIATPNHTHRELVLTCIERGVPVLIEKPLALSVAEGQEIVDSAERHGVSVAVGYNTRFRNNVKMLKALLDDNYFGVVKRFVHQFGTSGGWAPLSSYILDRDSTGGGVLVVTGSHFLDRLLYLWGFPDELGYEDDSQGGPEANCRAFFRYKRADADFHGVALYSKTYLLPGMLLIETDKGVVKLADTDIAEIIFRSHRKPELEEIIRNTKDPAFSDGISPYQRQYEDFERTIRKKVSPTVDGKQGLESLRLIETLYKVRRQINVDWYGNRMSGAADE